MRCSPLNAALALFRSVMSKRVFMWSIVAGLIASILLSYVLEPFSVWLWRSLSDSASSWAQELQSKAIQNAAMGVRPWVSAVSFIVTINTISGLFLGLVIAFTFKTINGKFGRKGNHSESTNNNNKTWLLFTGVSACNVLLFIYFALRISFLVYVDLQMNASFVQRMTAIKPYITQQEYDLLYSNWALMTSPEDYTNINTQLDKSAQVAEIKLPAVMYK